MRQKKVEFSVQIWLFVVLIILFVLAVAGIYQIRGAITSMSDMVYKNQLKVELAHAMRDSIRLREISINKMLSMNDLFERDEELLNFYQYVGIYRNARTRLLELPMDVEEKEIHTKLQEVVRVAQPLNNKAAELILKGSQHSLIFKAVKSASIQQQKLLKHLDTLVDYQNNHAREAVLSGTETYDRYLYIVILFAVILVISLFFIRKVAKFIMEKNHELTQKNEQLAIASDAALSANNTKSAFLATMSHEIRTPLTAIIGFAEVSLDSEQTMLDRIKSTKTIIESGKHLLHIINDILDISKIEANKLELEEIEFSLFDLLKDVEAIVKPLADSKGLIFKIQYEFPIPEIIISDPLRLKQILINLTSNAVKFTDIGRVLIDIAFDKEQKYISFNVIDSGIGMTDEESVKIFDAFTQADSSTTRKYGGTGLGLSLSKELALQMGGDIIVKSLPNTGSKFKLTINAGKNYDFKYVNEIPESIRVEEQVFYTNNYTGKVLLAEDDKNNQRILSHFIKKLGVSINIADNGKIAVDMAKKEDYDLILMDMQMPVLGGLDAVKQLRASGYQQPIVALTANAMKNDKDNCLNAGCDDFLTKPIEHNELNRVAAIYLPKYCSVDKIGSKIVSTFIKDEPALMEVADKFCLELPGMFKILNQLVHEQNWSELDTEIHKLKGTGGGMGFPILTEIAGQIEFQIANENKQAVDKLIIKLANTINQIIKPAVLDIPNTNNSH